MLLSMAEETRIDKYLWAIRVYKTRSDATDACKGGKVRLNGNDVKPSKPVKPGDVICARKGAVQYTYNVLSLTDKRVGAKLVPDYAENITPQEELDKLRHPVETFFLKRDPTMSPMTLPMNSAWMTNDFGSPGKVCIFNFVVADGLMPLVTIDTAARRRKDLECFRGRTRFFAALRMTVLRSE